ncbi:MAG: choice-of-anchor D domain-containing protein [Pseudomonadota bacterium]|nr:choice-of-anchor D domain-containing protein [Pseudomonadota bacterium]
MLLLLGCSDYAVTGRDAAPAPAAEAEAVGAPDIDVAPRAADFGTVASGASVAGSLTVRNTGDAVLTLSAVRLVDTTGSFTLTMPDGMEVTPGRTRSVAVSFAPTAPGRVEASVEFASDDPDEPSVTVPLVGATASVLLAIDPGLYEFGTLDPLESETAAIVLANAGEGDLVIQDLAYTASSSELTLADYVGTYGALPWTLGPGETRTVAVDYRPRDDTPDEGRLAVASSDPHGPRFAAQTGNGTRPPLPETGWFELYDGVLYETTSSAEHEVDHHGDIDLYWYEPSGAHGLVDSADPAADFARLSDYVQNNGTVVFPVAPIDVSDRSAASTFTQATFTYWLCLFEVPAEDDPAAWSASADFVDDGLLLLVNGERIDSLVYTESGAWNLADVVRPGETNALLAILVDDSSGSRIVTGLSLERDGVFVE